MATARGYNLALPMPDNVAIGTDDLRSSVADKDIPDNHGNEQGPYRFARMECPVFWNPS